MADKAQLENFAFAQFTESELCMMGDNFIHFIEHIKAGNETELKRLFNNLSDDIEPRQLYAYCKLLNGNGLGHIRQKRSNELYGVVFQIGLQNGIETLAVYPNREGWYINYTGGAIKLNPLSENEDRLGINPLIDALFETAVKTVPGFELPDNNHIPDIITGNLRINLLTGKGLFSAESALNAIVNTSSAGEMFNLGTKILQRLVAMSGK
ncbi:MAG: hypothetical protein FWD34_01360 [Oscillospiraceae bacterium]|nr:hypothetical protein [Oscillospiraceae bacterium]